MRAGIPSPTWKNLDGTRKAPSLFGVLEQSQLVIWK